MNAQKEIKALEKFLTAYNELTENFNNDTMINFYPFKESFNEINIRDWVSSAIELTNLMEVMKLKKRFITSKVKLTKEVIKIAYNYEIQTDSAYIYLNGYFIEVNNEGNFVVIYNNNIEIFETIEKAEEHFFNNFIKHEFTA